MKIKHGILLASLLIAAQVSATDLASGIYIAPSLSYQKFGSNILNDDFDLDSKEGFSFGVGYQFDSPWALELAFTSVNTQLDSGYADVDTEYWHLDGLYHLGDDNNNNWSSYFVAGLGQQSFEATGYDESDVQLNLGYGIKYLFSSNFYARSDLRATVGAEDADVGALFNLGIVYIFGSSSNTKSVREHTRPAEEQVEEQVKEVVDEKVEEVIAPVAAITENTIDTDADRVTDDMDKCPDTVSGAKVDETGCLEVLEEAKEFTLGVHL